MKKFLYILLCLNLFCGSCHRSLKTGDYIRWIKNKNNGLYKEKEVDNYVFGLQYKPLDYVALLEQRTNEKFDKARFEKDKGQMNGLEHYTFTIRTKVKGNPLKEGISDEKEGFEREDYFSYNLQKDLLLIEGRDTLSCSFCHFERTYELSPVITFILGFENRKDKKETDRQFIYKDRVLGTGTIKIIIKSAAIRRMPSLKLY